MKNIFIIVGSLLLFINCNSLKNNKISSYELTVNRHRNDLHSMYLSKEGPLNKNQKKDFIGIDYFPIDSNYKVNALFTANVNKSDTIILQTSADKERKYINFGKLQFTLNKVSSQLDLYQSVGKNKHFFLPLRDLTSGNESYGGGRYLDLEIKDLNNITLDFNYLYNPYCAYVTGFSCPIPPKDNFVNTEIKAGARNKNSIFLTK